MKIANADAPLRFFASDAYIHPGRFATTELELELPGRPQDFFKISTVSLSLSLFHRHFISSLLTL